MKKIFAVIAAILAAATLQACGSSSPSLSRVKMCNDADEAGTCEFDSSTFSTNDGDIYLSAELENVSDGMKVNATWISLKESPGVEMNSFTSDVTDNGSFPYHTYLSPPEKGWPTGDYEVTLTLSGDDVEPVKKQFSIK